MDQASVDTKYTARQPGVSPTSRFALQRLRNSIILERTLVEEFDMDVAFASLSSISKQCGFNSSQCDWK